MKNNFKWVALLLGFLGCLLVQAADEFKKADTRLIALSPVQVENEQRPTSNPTGNICCISAGPLPRSIDRNSCESLYIPWGYKILRMVKMKKNIRVKFHLSLDFSFILTNFAIKSDF